MNQQDLATTFRRLHRHQPLVLPNAWDAGSARVIERAGAHAIATTSAGVSWTLGRRDGHGLRRSQAMDALRAIVEAVRVPVSADIESGYGSGTGDDVADTVAAVLDAGAVGINLEDSPGLEGGPLLAPEQQAERIRAARTVAQAKGVDLFINARTDVYLATAGESAERLENVIQRAAIYLDAGADGVFVPAVTDIDTIAALVAGIDAPLNIMAGPGAPDIRELAKLGVVRVSLGPALTLGALGFVERAVNEVLTEGTYHALDQGLSYGEADGLFADGLSVDGLSVDA